MKGYSLKDLIKVEMLQSLQDSFARYTGMAALLTDADGTPITKGSGFTNFCMNLTRKSKLGYERCKKCDREGAIKTLEQGKAVAYYCHAGLIDYAAPIIVDGDFLGSFIGGQVRPPEFDEAKMLGIAKELGINPEEYLREAKKARERSREDVEKAATFIGQLAEILSKLAFESFMALKKSQGLQKNSSTQLAYIQNTATTMRDSLKSWSSQINDFKDKAISDEVREGLTQLFLNIDEQYSKIDDSLNFLQFSDGKITINEITYSLKDHLNVQVMNIQNFLAYKKYKVNISVNVDKSVPQFMFGDIGKIEQIITKIIVGSVANSNVKNIKVEAFCKNYDYSKILFINLTDDGNGIKRDELLKIQKYLKTGLSVFVQGLESAAQGFPVVGMIVRQIHGRISIRSEYGKRTSVTIQVPQLEIKETFDEI